MMGLSGRAVDMRGEVGDGHLAEALFPGAVLGCPR